MKIGHTFIMINLLFINFAILDLRDEIKNNTKTVKNTGHLIDFSIRSARYDYILKYVTLECSKSIEPTVKCIQDTMKCINKENSKIDDFDYMKSYLKCKELI